MCSIMCYMLNNNKHDRMPVPTTNFHRSYIFPYQKLGQIYIPELLIKNLYTETSYQFKELSNSGSMTLLERDPRV